MGKVKEMAAQHPELYAELPELVRQAARERPMLTVTLPWPPTVNTYYRNLNGKTLISAKGQEYRKAVAEQVRIQVAKMGYAGRLGVLVEAYPGQAQPRPDNILKSLLDSLTKAGCGLTTHRLMTCKWSARQWAAWSGCRFGLRGDSMNLDRILTSVPVNQTAARVVSRKRDQLKQLAN